MQYADVLDRLSALGGRKWALHVRARELAAAGCDIIELTIGEPDAATPDDLVEAAVRALRAGRTGYSSGRGEMALRQALARRYSTRTGSAVTPDRVLCFPGTQSALYAVLNGIAGPGDEVLVGDPMYATYAGLIASCGARAVAVPLDPGNGFRLRAADIAARVTPSSRAILLNSPHNPTGAVIDSDDLREIGGLAVRHDLWLVCDEVYEELVFPGVAFASALSFPELGSRAVVVSSISKSHAAPGFRSGWCVGSVDFCDRLLPLSETMLFGNPPFIADATAAAVAASPAIARDMSVRFARRLDRLVERIEGESSLRVNRPRGGMFALIDVAATGMPGEAFAHALLDAKGVALMPGSSFGDGLGNWVRLSLAVGDTVLEEAATRIVDFAVDAGARRAAT